MFNNLFKKKPQVSQTEVEATKSVIDFAYNPNNYPKEVLEIHHEFSIAAELLLEDAKNVIAEAATKDVNKVKRLEKLGFKQAAQVTDIKPLIQKAELSKEQIELVKYYQFNYPNNKFITEYQVMAICHKWNLVCGDVGRFKGFIPEKNLLDIEKFKFNEDDGVVLIDDGWFNWENSTMSIKDALKIVHSYYEKPLSVSISNKLYSNDDREGLIFSELGRSVAIRIPKNNFQICAPIKDMDITGLELQDGYKLKKIHVPDPVVLQPVRGGYLILTAWGDEASDENVVNQKMN